MTRELDQVFKYLHKQKEPEPFQHLIVSQFRALERFEELINREIRNKRLGKPAKIYVKINNLEEPNLIYKLYEAALAGVEVKLMVRSICCLVPGTNGLRVSRIVDRFLEHARIFYFYNEGKEDLYMGSTDWMNRNLHRRIEVTFPVLEKHIREQILHILKLQFADTVKRMDISSTLENIPLPPESNAVRAQLKIYEYIRQL